MAKQTVKLMFTKPDRGTQPGGLILRKDDDGSFVTHRFNRAPHSRTPTEFFWGHYHHGEDAEHKAHLDYNERAMALRSQEVEEVELIAKGDVGYQPFDEDPMLRYQSSGRLGDVS